MKGAPQEGGAVILRFVGREAWEFAKAVPPRPYTCDGVGAVGGEQAQEPRPDPAGQTAGVNGKPHPILPTEHPHSYTVLRAVLPAAALLTKEFTKDRQWISYGGKGNRPGAFLYSARTIDVVSLDALEAELRLLDKEPRCCFVAGAVAEGTDRSKMRRIKLEHKDKKTGEVHPPTLRDVPRRLLPLDVDSLDCPDGADPKDLNAAAAHIRAQLPSALRNAACIAQATSGHCIKPKLRFRMFFLMDRALTSTEIKAWLANVKAPVDLSIYQPQAVVYTAAPVFEDARHDPLPGGRIVRLDGAEFVTPPPVEWFEALAKPSKPRPDRETVICSDDWRKLQEALTFVPDADVYETWLKVGMALHWALENAEEPTDLGLELWDEWSQTADNYDPAALEAKWDSFDATRGGAHGPTTVGYILTTAREHGYKDTLDDQMIRERIEKLHRETESFDKLSPEYAALKDQAIELFSKSSDNYRGDPKERKFFWHQWNMDATTLRKRLEAYDRKNPKPKPKPDPEPGEGAGMVFGKNGPISNVYNAFYLLTHRPDMRGVFRFNEMTLEVEVARHIPGCDAYGEYPRTLEENDITQTMRWLQADAQGLSTISDSNTRKAIEDAARLDAYHPIRDWLQGLVWDDVARLDDWLFTYAGAKVSKDPEQAERDRAYIRKIGAWFLMQMCARVSEPGCQADYVLTVKGLQGFEKSKAGRALVGDKYFTDNLPKISNEAGALRKLGLHVKGRWLVELSERASVGELEDYRAFVTRRIDKYQRPFGRGEVDQPRQCCFFSTTNDNEPLRDVTGNRRDWVFESEGFDIPALLRDREQLFAEAYHRYRSGERYWPTREEQAGEFNVQQDANLLTEPWQEMLDACLSPFESVKGVCLPPESILDCLKDRLGKVVYGKQYGPFLRRLGWENEPFRIQSRGGTLKRYWRRADQRELWAYDDEGVEQVKPQFLVWKPRSAEAVGNFYLSDALPGGIDG
ncbi:VapE domain-containing protein [Methylocystis sp. IM2]|uniref:VapE domain-containing protein n=1 Tax=Methylocystis sp. IM2 TaxID=3136563 RepID=UPI0030F9B564